MLDGCLYDDDLQEVTLTWSLREELLTSSWRSGPRTPAGFSLFGVSWGHLGGSWGRLGCTFGVSRLALDAILVLLGSPLDDWRPLGRLLDDFGVILTPF